MSKPEDHFRKGLELKTRDWRESRDKRELPPEKLFNIIASVDGEKRAIEKMMDLGFDVSQWIKVESEEENESS